MVHTPLRVGGSTYVTGLVPGAILGIGTGNVENPDDPDVRVWRVRRNWETADFSGEVAEHDGLLSIADIRQQYQTDWNEWPAAKGAPFEDVDDDGTFDPQIDIPGIPGSDQTIWYVANDINAGLYYDSPPIGLEMQVTMWAYYRPENDPFRDIVFKKVRLIYKGTSGIPANSTIEDMYIMQWSDPDLGDYKDDYVGCDSSLSMGFVYNNSTIDLDFGGYDLLSPAFGYVLLHGPVVYSPGDTTLVDFMPVADHRNLSMSSFLYY